MCLAIVVNLGQMILGIMLALRGKKTGLHHCKKLLNEARFILGTPGVLVQEGHVRLFLLGEVKCYKQTPKKKAKTSNLLRLRRLSTNARSTLICPLVVNVGYAGFENEPAVCMRIAVGMGQGRELVPSWPE